jgi:hypothetical protein
MYMGLMMDGRWKYIQLSSVPELSSFEFQVAIANVKKYKSPGIDQILAKLIQAVGETLHSEIQEVFNSI